MLAINQIIINVANESKIKQIEYSRYINYLQYNNS